MIIAEIGSRKFALDSLEDAETLIRIIHRAKAVDNAYGDFGNGYERNFFYSPRGIDIEISVSGTKVIDYEDYLAMKKCRETETEPSQPQEREEHAN